MEFRNKEIELVFENLECMTVVASGEFDIVIAETIDNIKLTIQKSENGIYIPLGIEDYETTKFNKLNKSNDITQIIIDGITYFPKWYDGDKSYTQYNKYQHTYRSENGDMIINISTFNKQQEDDSQNIISTLSDFMEENPSMSFGKIVHVIECKLGSSVIDAKNETVIAMLEELMMEAI